MTPSTPKNQFLEDAMYMHYIHLGYSEERARSQVALHIRRIQNGL